MPVSFDANTLESRPTYPQLCANLTEFAARERLREDAGIQKAEQIPLRTRLGLEVPEHPALCDTLVSLQLRLDVATHIVLEDLGPLINRVDEIATAEDLSAWIAASEGAAVTVASAKAWRSQSKSLRAQGKGLRRSPFSQVAQSVIAAVHSPTNVHLSAPL